MILVYLTKISTMLLFIAINYLNANFICNRKKHDILRSVIVSFRQPSERLETDHSSHNEVFIIFDIISMR